jgi:hypothetical protein
MWLLLDKGIPVLLAAGVGWVAYQLGRTSERVEWLSGRRDPNGVRQ